MKRTAAIVTILLIFSQAFGQVDFLQNIQKHGLDFYWDPYTESGVVEKNGHRVSFKAGDDFMLEDYKKIINEKAPYFSDKKLIAEQAFFNMMTNRFKQFPQETQGTTYSIGAILIDPGHGGKDPGATGIHSVNGKKIKVVEKDVNLFVAKKLCEHLRIAYPNKKILMTREKDVFLSLAQRTEIANSVKLKDHEAILYVSVHVNSSLDKTASGYEVWYLSPGYRRQVLNTKSINEDKSLLPILNSMMEEEYTTESILIAKFIMDGISDQVGKQSSPRGIKAEEWFVCKNSNMPSVLIEVGFLSNKNEAALLADNSYLKKLSFGIYNGLNSFVTHFEKSRGFTGR